MNKEKAKKRRKQLSIPVPKLNSFDISPREVFAKLQWRLFTSLQVATVFLISFSSLRILSKNCALKKDMAGAIKEQLDMEEDFNQLPGKGPWHVVR